MTVFPQYGLAYCLGPYFVGMAKLLADSLVYLWPVLFGVVLVGVVQEHRTDGLNDSRGFGS